ncbi:uncharacterized protein EV420DRAFT_1554269 [Desarmillaria tabescens]|uniref:Uncharacterized protein n=1 Tax=Armillaria tabescens TaxID=1929756 RepID=A0AA39K6N6_ARMTA|nr:uncharacterized protein EV420DRAFT_1554269 [Desarmillaria tabescens]KAK0455556.1 hypothetical protein EV420DRAFT_1554269 [Desarmillaria tabescens]
MAARHEYAPVTPFEDPINSFVGITSALIHDCIEYHQGRGTLVSLSIQNADLPQRYWCLSRLAELRDQDGRDSQELRHVLRRVAEEWIGESARRGRQRRDFERFHLRFSEFVREVRQSLALSDSVALRGHRDRIRAFLGVQRVGAPQGGLNDARVGDRREAVALYDVLQGLDALLHGRRNHGNILSQLVSLDTDNLLIRHPDMEELIMARDVICGIVPGPSILTFETAVRRFFVSLLATRGMIRFFQERQKLARLCERVVFGEQDAVDALDEARQVLHQEAPNSQPQPQ